MFPVCFCALEFINFHFIRQLLHIKHCSLSIIFSHALQVEPSPTTGSFAKLFQTVHGSTASNASVTFPVTTVCFNTSAVDEGKSSFFEFKPHNRSNMVINY